MCTWNWLVHSLPLGGLVSCVFSVLHIHIEFRNLNW
ncbi:uncharacterized protein DEA37_0002690 [Paragonimus westermani]|uniref:Uncharacterized protein n=1 Tax=Paragonimus westermani TaxID=34504 RepID=A0A5J4N7H9_9TREM|nr:uncharacterized protein DEA37_0002690 [Paragonimus westermani]